MQNIEEKIKELEARLDKLVQQQNVLNLSIFALSEEINRIKRLPAEEKIVSEPVAEKPKPVPVQQETIIPIVEKTSLQTQTQQTKPGKPLLTSSKGFEEFIGRNIASKVGILVTIIGVFIGAKYAI